MSSKPLPDMETPTDHVHALIVAASVGIEATRANLQTALRQCDEDLAGALIPAMKGASVLADLLAEIESVVRHDAGKED